MKLGRASSSFLLYIFTFLPLLLKVNGFFTTQPQGMPKLFDGWFSNSGAISKGIVSGVKASSAVGQPVLLLFPSVPNIDEVSFGTALNAKWGKEAAINLGMPPYKPGSLMRTYLIQFSNVYWAKTLADGLPGTSFGIFTDGLKKDCITKSGKLKIASLRRPESYQSIKPGDTAIVVSPGPGDWKKCAAIFKAQKLIFLNPQVNPSYELGGPLKDLDDAYYLKRVSKGWVYRLAPGQWQAWLEKPDGSVELLKAYADRPSLREISSFIREESFSRYGIFNDRYAPGFGERL